MMGAVAVPPPFRSGVARIAVYAHGFSKPRKKHAGVTSVVETEKVVSSSLLLLLLFVPRGQNANDARVDVGM
jgi:hypothetical protein